MFPTILELGPFALHSWGLLLAIAFVTGIALAWKRAKRRSMNPQKIVDLAVVIIISAVVGGRAAFVLTHLGDFKNSPFEIFAIWHGGMAFYGGAILAFFTGLIYVRRKGLSLWQVADVIAPSLALGLFIGRLGCFLNGCCFGEPTSLPWGIVFPGGSYAEQVYGPGIHVHPTQVYSSLAGLAIFFLLLWMERWWRFDGSLFWRFVILHSLWRIVVDFWRYCEPSSMVEIGGVRMASSQATCAGLILVSIVMLLVLGTRKPTVRRRGRCLTL